MGSTSTQTVSIPESESHPVELPDGQTPQPTSEKKPKFSITLVSVVPL